MNTAQLRRTFKYPADNEDDDLPEPLDEDEQDKIISNLRHEDVERNALYTKIFLMVPLVLCLPYMPILVASRSTYQMRLLVVLSITSLLCTAYTLKYIPLPKKDRKGKRPVRAHVGLFDEHGPLRRYLGWLNGAIGALLCLAAWSRRGNDAAGDDGWWVLWLVPGGKVDSQWCSRFGNGQ